MTVINQFIDDLHIDRQLLDDKSLVQSVMSLLKIGTSKEQFISMLNNHYKYHQTNKEISSPEHYPAPLYFISKIKKGCVGHVFKNLQWYELGQLISGIFENKQMIHNSIVVDITLYSSSSFIKQLTILKYTNLSIPFFSLYFEEQGRLIADSPLKNKQKVHQVTLACHRSGEVWII